MLAGVAVLIAACFNSICNMAASRVSAERVAVRMRLAAARRFFRDELQKEQPQLRDAWFPYVIAFGLGREADKWFRAFGAAAVGVRGVGVAGAGSASHARHGLLMAAAM